MHQQQPSLVNQADGYQMKSHHNIWKIAGWCVNHHLQRLPAHHIQTTQQIPNTLTFSIVFYWETTHSAKKVASARHSLYEAQGSIHNTCLNTKYIVSPKIEQARLTTG